MPVPKGLSQQRLAGDLAQVFQYRYASLNFLIPITRYLGFIWMLLAAVKLTRNRTPASPLGSELKLDAWRNA